MGMQIVSTESGSFVLGLIMFVALIAIVVILITQVVPVNYPAGVVT